LHRRQRGPTHGRNDGRCVPRRQRNGGRELRDQRVLGCGQTKVSPHPGECRSGNPKIAAIPRGYGERLKATICLRGSEKTNQWARHGLLGRNHFSAVRGARGRAKHCVSGQRAKST
jgi:hypothetical protein